LKGKGEKRVTRRENLQKKSRKIKGLPDSSIFFLGIIKFFYGFDLRRRRSKKKKEKCEKDGNGAPCGGEF